MLIDATTVRAVLLPAAMKLLGERSRYLPRWLEGLPSVSVEGPVVVAPASATTAAAKPRRAGEPAAAVLKPLDVAGAGAAASAEPNGSALVLQGLWLRIQTHRAEHPATLYSSASGPADDARAQGKARRAR
jgi:hypothetical protein